MYDAPAKFVRPRLPKLCSRGASWALGALLGACTAHDPALHGQFLHTQATIAAAEAMNGAANQAAAHHLHLAQQQLALGERLVQHGQSAAGRRQWHRAEADAALALALAREAPARALAQDALDQLRALEALAGPEAAEDL